MLEGLLKQPASVVQTPLVVSGIRFCLERAVGGGLDGLASSTSRRSRRREGGGPQQQGSDQDGGTQI